MMLMQRQPPLWLCLGLPLLALVWTVSIYQSQVITTTTHVAAGALAHSLSTAFQSQPAAPDRVWSPTVLRDGDHDEYLAVCLYVRNQAQDMAEFLQHHYYQMGIRRFYVMDDGSNPPMSQYMDKFGIPEEAVDFIYSPMKTTEPQGTQL